MNTKTTTKQIRAKQRTPSIHPWPAVAPGKSDDYFSSVVSLYNAHLIAQKFVTAFNEPLVFELSELVNEIETEREREKIEKRKREGGRR